MRKQIPTATSAWGPGGQRERSPVPRSSGANKGRWSPGPADRAQPRSSPRPARGLPRPTPPSRHLQDSKSSCCLRFTLVEMGADGGTATCPGRRGVWSQDRLGGRCPRACGEGTELGPGGPRRPRRWSPGPGGGTEPGAGKRPGITCCGGRRSAAAGRAQAPGPAVPEVAVGPPARPPGCPRPIGAIDGPEEAGGA